MSVVETQEPVLLTLTDNAAAKVHSLVEEEGNDNLKLRVFVTGGGCSGFTYVLGFDVAKDKDVIYDLNGIKILMEKAHGIYLIGMEIDWHEGLNNRGFTFNNPNASDTCGCGTSFSA